MADEQKPPACVRCGKSHYNTCPYGVGIVPSPPLEDLPIPPCGGKDFDPLKPGDTP